MAQKMIDFFVVGGITVTKFRYLFVVLNMFHYRWFVSTMLRELRRSLVWTCTLQMSVRHVSSEFVKWHVSAAVWMLNQQKILVHSFVTLRVDYFNLLLASAPKKVADMLQRVQNTGSQETRALSFTPVAW